MSTATQRELTMTQSNTNTSENTKKPRKGKIWPWLLVSLLSFGCGMNIYMVIVAVNDPSFAIEKNYYKKALNWDQTMAQRSMNAKLKWRIELKTEPLLVDKKARLRLHAKVLDRSGKLIPGAHVSAEVFHNARSNQRARLDLTRRSTNVHQGEVAFHRR
ncbi:MAG: hypothetical protein EP343_22440, partial [Deltaproteobacteria bacterium]